MADVQMQNETKKRQRSEEDETQMQQESCKKTVTETAFTESANTGEKQEGQTWEGLGLVSDIFEEMVLEPSSTHATTAPSEENTTDRPNDIDNDKDSLDPLDLDMELSTESETLDLETAHPVSVSVFMKPVAATATEMFNEVMGVDMHKPKSPQPQSPKTPSLQLHDSLPGPDAENPKPKKECMQKGLDPPDLDDDWENFPVNIWKIDIFKLLSNAGLDSAEWYRPLRVVTLCSGLGTPCLALRELGIPFTEWYGADPKDSCLQIAENAGLVPKHFYSCVQDVLEGLLEGGRQCKIHAGWSCESCSTNMDNMESTEAGGAPPDFLVAGFPCAPFSSQRPGRFSQGETSWRNHPETKVMQDVAAVIRSSEPRAGLLENVVGFLKMARTDHVAVQCCSNIQWHTIPSSQYSFVSMMLQCISYMLDNEYSRSNSNK